MVDVDKDDICWGKQLRVKVRLDLTQPITPGRTVSIEGDKYQIAILYEKLPRVCFSCGCIIHNPKTCKNIATPNNEDKKFGPGYQLEWITEEDPFTPHELEAL